MSSELRDCPFCGEIPVITKHFREDMHQMVHRCKVVGPILFDFGDACRHIKAWNTRAPMELTDISDEDFSE